MRSLNRSVLVSTLALAMLGTGCMSATDESDLIVDPDAVKATITDTYVVVPGEATIARIPIEHMGCPMGARLSLSLISGDADISVGGMNYSQGVIGPIRRRIIRVNGEVWGQPLDGVSDDWTIAGFDPFDSGTSTAAIMLLGQTTARVEGSGCEVDYGSHPIDDSDRNIAMSLNVTRGSEAEVEWQIDWFDCSTDTYEDALHEEVCSEAWEALYSVAVGGTVESSSCPFRDPQYCAIWDETLGLSSATVGEADVRAAVRQACRAKTVLNTSCC